MLRTILAALAALLALAASICCTACAEQAQISAPETTRSGSPAEHLAASSASAPAEETAAPDGIESLIRSLVPEWAEYEVGKRQYSARGISTGRLDGYISFCKRSGFLYVRDYEHSNGMHLLYRDGLWIEIHDNTRGDSGQCSVDFLTDEGCGAIDKAQAAKLIAAGHSAEPISLIEQSPDGLNELGMQLFRAAFDLSPSGEPVSGRMYTVEHYLVGGSEAVFLGNLSCCAVGDLDGDGGAEVVVFQGMPISRVMAMESSVFIAGENGEPKRIGRDVVTVNVGRFSLVSHDGLVYLSYALGLGVQNGRAVYAERKEYPVLLKDGRLAIDDPENEVGFHYMSLALSSDR